MPPQKLQKQVDDLLAWKKSMESSHSIPLNIDQAFNGRFLLGSTPITTSSKSAASARQGVDEAGSNTYNVMIDPDGFLKVVVNATTYHIPIFTS